VELYRCFDPSLPRDRSSAGVHGTMVAAGADMAIPETGNTLSGLLRSWGIGGVLAVGVAAVGCSTDDPRSVDEDVGFAPYADMDHGAMAREIAAPPSYPGRGKAGRVHVAPDGTIRVDRFGTLVDPFDKILERYSSDGLLEDSRSLGQDDVSVVNHPDGDLTLVRSSADSTSYTRWSSSFRPLAHATVLRSAALVPLPDFYRIAADGTFTVETGGAAVEPQGMFLVADRDGGFYGVQHFAVEGKARGARLVRLDAAHATVNATWLFPGTEMPIAWQGKPLGDDGPVVTVRHQFAFEQMLVDHDRRVWVLATAPDLAAPALSEFTGHPVELRDPADTKDVFVLRFSPALELEAVISLSAANSQLAPSIAEAADGTIGVVAASLAPHPVEPNKTINFNTWLATIDRDGRVITTRELDLGDDDAPYAMSACLPGFCIAGELGTRWVDTRSQVEFAQGFVLAIGTDGSPAGMATLHGPRHNVIDSLAARADGSVVFAGSSDGPITHTDAHEWQSIALIGVVPF
jgi:hypothetical protein